jgi:hypothetical protein
MPIRVSLLRVSVGACLVLGTSIALGGCPDPVVEPAPLFAADYADTFVEVRDCRQSGDHDLHVVRVLADPVALDAYSVRDRPFPVGAMVLKEEYEFGDIDCTGPVVEWTVMEKLEVGSDPDNLDWFWQTVDADRTVLDENMPRCAGCHMACGVPPDGHDGTCTLP